MTTNDFMSYLSDNFPSIDFSNGYINRNKEMVVGIYLSSSPIVTLAIGGTQNSSYGTLPISILVHWTKDSNECEGLAKSIYDFLLGKSNFETNGIRVASIQMQESSPVNISRDEKGFCEMVIRCNIIYSK